MFLPDVNFWLALAFASHDHHLSASNWIEAASPQSVVFCRITQLGFLRLATNRKAFPIDAVTMEQSWQHYDAFLSDERVGFVDEPEQLELQIRRFTHKQTFSTNVWTDAYLAAFAVTLDFDLVTFDKGFLQFDGLRVTVLS